MPLDQYLKSFSRLRTDKNRKRWAALTAWLPLVAIYSSGTLERIFHEH